MTATKTLADLDALGDDARAELIDGVIYELLPPYQRGRGGTGGWWIQGENDFVADGQCLRPDAIGWRVERMPEPPRTGRVPVVPDWVCEVVSESDRAHDEVRKRAAYARVGVRWWWLVDPNARTLTVHVLEDGGWRVVARHSGDDVVRAAPFEGVELSMKEWWR